MLARELPNARLLHAESIIELRTRPERLTGQIADFVDACWDGDDGELAAEPEAATA
jgi:hypothetical protein